MEKELKNIEVKNKIGTVVEEFITEPTKKRIGVYSGSFDPITLGHLDIIKKSVEEFDEVIIAVLVNPDKKGLFTIEERLYMIKQVIKAENLQNIKVEAFNGLFVDFMKKYNATASIRGLRTSEDFIYEQNIYMINKDFSDDFETHCFMANPLRLHCSSSTVRGLLPFTTEIGHYVHNSIKDCLIGFYNRSNKLENLNPNKMETVVEEFINEPTKKRIGVYSGSFDPITLGHLDIIKKSVKEFDEVIVAMLVNPEKKYLFTIEERLHMIKQIIKAENLQNIKIEVFNGLFVDFMKKHNATASIRGLRTSEDFIYEQNIYMINKDFSDDFETHCFIANPLMLHCSSSTVRGLLPFTTEIGHYIHDSIKDYLIDVYKKKK